MNKFKLIVFLCCVVSCACYSKYCKISIEHVLCKYPVPGPSMSCKEYDGNTFLTDDDINDLVNRINERRNFISMGHSRQLPGAANMNKIMWSNELAIFAQRWVDQCDPSLRPDKEDQCRDLEHQKVGQNIASIINPSREFNVRSFVEIWFMKSLDYNGSVSYYDQRQDFNSNDFTQLIWAETNTVGCGRAKFSVNNINVDRIVCNFSPKGNIHGKPVYAIGFPGTQCSNEMVPDEKYKGLCTQQHPKHTKFSSTNLPVSSLLRILNLSNDSVKQDIDPIYNNIKQINRDTNEMARSRHQIIRHILRNKSILRRPDGIYHDVNFWENPVNVSRYPKRRFPDLENNHSRLHHTHVLGYNDQPINNHKMENIRKYGLPIIPPVLNSEDIYRKYNFNKLCTRSSQCHNENCELRSTTPYAQIAYQCTRGQKNNCKPSDHSSKTESIKNVVQHIIPHDLCPCETFSTTEKSFSYELNCECVDVNGRPIRYPNVFRTLKYHMEKEKRNSEVYDDFNEKILYSKPNPLNENNRVFHNGRKHELHNKRSGYIQNNRDRRKRETKSSLPAKPFWQIDSFNNERNSELKYLRYTTLLDKRRPKPKKQPSPFIHSTEPITLKIKSSIPKLATEKYLSFDELLHLRKSNLSTQSARRNMEPSILRQDEETTFESTSEYTTNTPFIRMKYCSRRLTCTWTAASITDKDGSVINGGGVGGNVGSRTPPGYVEGCTRTSTCTRDYMDRNIFPTVTTPNSTHEDEEESDDYCERRSLNVQKRNMRIKKRALIKARNQLKNCLPKCRDNYLNKHETLMKDKITFKKRRNINNFEHRVPLSRGQKKSKCTNTLSYNDLFYLVLRKIIGNRENSNTKNPYCQCHSNSSTVRQKFKIMLILSLKISLSLKFII